MNFSLCPELTRPWPAVLDACRRAEAAGFACVWLADHLMADDDRDPALAILECWTTAAALLAATRRIDVGTLVSANAFRHPALVANMTATLQSIGDGRFRLGLGAGGQANEHLALGFAFPPLPQRAAALDEAATVVRSLLEEPVTTFSGTHYTLTRARLHPKPPRTSMLVGGADARWTLPVVARHADAWSIWGTPAELRETSARLDACCREVGRDPAEIRRSAIAGLLISDDAQTLDRARAGDPLPASMIGTPEHVADLVADYARAGVTELVISDFPVLSPALTEASLARLAAEVAPRLEPPAG